MNTFTTVTLYEQIRNTIAKRIENGQYTPGEKLPTEKEFGAEFKVSRITITKALSVLAQQGFIVKKQGKGTFVAEHSPRSNPVLASGGLSNSTRNIGVLIPTLADGHSAQLTSGIIDRLPFPQYMVNIVPSATQKLEDYALQTFVRQGYDGLVIFPVDLEVYNEDLLALHVKKFPFVLIDRNFHGVNTHYVISDNHTGTRLATKHLLELNHRNLVFCSTVEDDEVNTSIRFGEFVRTLRQFNIPFTALQDMRGLLSHPSRLQQLENLISKRRITGIVSSNIGTTSILHEMCSRLGVSIPDELSIVCFDDPGIANKEGSFFTYIDQQSYQMGCHAATILDGILTGTVQEPVHEILEQRLVVNHSTAFCIKKYYS